MKQDYNNLTLNMEGLPVAMVGWEIGPWCIGIHISVPRTKATQSLSTFLSLHKHTHTHTELMRTEG